MDYQSSSDEQLLAAYRGDGNERALRALMDRHWDAAVCTCYLVIIGEMPGKLEMAVAAVNEGFARLCRYWQPGGLSVRNALFEWSKHAVKRAARHARRHLVEPGPEDWERELVDKYPLPDRILELESVRRAVGELPEREQQAVILRYYCNETYKEIARDLGLTDLHAARRLVLNAVRDLKQILGWEDCDE